MAAATAVEAAPASTMEATAAAEPAASATTRAVCYAATCVAMRHTAAGISTAYATRVAATTVAIPTAAVTAATISVSTAIAVSVTAPAMTPAPSIPRADAKKDAAVKPVRTVIAVGGAGIRVIRVVAPLAIRGTVIAVISGIHHRWADAHTYPDLGIRHDGERQNHKHCQQN
jgi:hypothetical protein